MSVDENCLHRFGNMDTYPRICWGCGKNESEINTARMTKMLCDMAVKKDEATKAKEQPVALQVVIGYDKASPKGDFGSLTFRKGETVTAVLYGEEAKVVAEYIKELAVAKPEADIEAAVVALAKRMAKNTEGTDAGYEAWVESMGRVFEAEAKACAEAWGLVWE